MGRELTRRELGALAASAAALSAQAPPPSAPTDADEELKAARDLVRKNIDQLAKSPPPMDVEPACHFKP